MGGDKGTVCVTEGTGFIGSWLIKRLLQEGYSVRTTVRADPVKRVVYTSSAATVIYNGQEMDMMDESFCTDVDFVTQKLNPQTHPYIISKTFTERAVLEFGTQHGLDVVTVNPGSVVGPFICPKFPRSVRSSLALGTDLSMVSF
ncbi:Dihydroflavonol-4-reductase [Gossypium arboreum]|uniref:Dihydroflavonol-4-reductase n=1 Tax=Gossypium arboreum TaxID=29729 RepID=A0A0B0NGB5_GOSAR|nr:Dihydroflavonol-4-reductase [Gossypium arboreum]